MKQSIRIMAFILLTFVQVSVIRADEISEFKEQLLDLKNRTAKLEAQQKTEIDPTDFRMFWKDGLNLTTQDGNFKLKVGGRLMNDWLWIREDTDIKADVGKQEDGIEFRRARLYFSGLIYANVEYKLQLDFAGGDADFKDAYLGLTDFPLGRLRMGRFKEPFSLEELTSSKYITFLERALPNVFAPSRNTGLMLHRSEFDNRMTSAVGVFRDTDEYGEEIDDGGYNLTGRITALPMYENNGAFLIHVGAAYSYRNPDDSVHYRERPEAHLTDRFVDTSSFASDQVDILGLEAALINGPISLQGEYTIASVNRTDGSDDVDFDGYYVQASYFLTGEHRNYKTSEAAFSRVKPKENFSYVGGLGAWELAARYSELDLNDQDITGGELRNITRGLNWYLNPNTKIMWNYVHAEKVEVGRADLLMMRLQIDF